MTTGEAADMISSYGSVAESSVASDVVYVNGPLLAILVIVFIFLFVAMTDNSMFVGCALFVALVSVLFAFLSWRSLADYPLTYREGDPPRIETQGGGLYDKWKLGPGATVGATLDVDKSSKVESLAGELTVRYGCPAARVDWRIYVDGDLLASGTLREGQERKLANAAVRSGHPSIIVRLTAARLDSSGCATDLVWHNPGLEGHGNGRFRFVLPLPDAV
ncbi:hypothetical protein [Actinoallomurus bryophytorum]|nr:hypothetical protein [Actinoallomurus bryophytorum]